MINRAKIAATPASENPPRSTSPTIRLTPYAWAKLAYLRDIGPTEIGGFGVSAVGEPLLVEDICLVRQRCDHVSVELDDAAVADFFDEQVDLGRRPEEFGRIWIHTHPGNSPRPSLTDDETFARVFGACQWAVMLILARGGEAYAELRFGVGPGGRFEVSVKVDYESAFPAADHTAWEAEYETCVEPLTAQDHALDLLGNSASDDDRIEDFDFFGAYDRFDLSQLREEANGD